MKTTITTTDNYIAIQNRGGEASITLDNIFSIEYFKTNDRFGKYVNEKTVGYIYSRVIEQLKYMLPYRGKTFSNINEQNKYEKTRLMYPVLEITELKGKKTYKIKEINREEYILHVENSYYTDECIFMYSN